MILIKGLVDPNAPVTEVKEVKHATLEQLELSVEAIEGGLEFPRPETSGSGSSRPDRACLPAGRREENVQWTFLAKGPDGGLEVYHVVLSRIYFGMWFRFRSKCGMTRPMRSFFA